MLAVLLTTGAGLILRHLEQTDSQGPFDEATVWPFWAGIGFVFLISTVVCIARIDRGKARCCHPEAFRPLLPQVNPNNGQIEMVSGVVRFFSAEVLRDHPCQLAFFYLLLLSLLTFVALALLRSCAEINWEWWQVFLPLCFVFAGLAAFPFYPVIRTLPVRDRWKNCGGLWLFVIGPVALFALLVLLRLSRSDVGIIAPAGHGSGGVTWGVVMAPLYLMEFYVMALILYASWEERNPGPFLGWFVVMGPFIAFKVMLAWWLDHGGSSSMKIASVFAPLWILMSWCLLTTLALWIGFHQPTASPSVLIQPRPTREPLML
jgi:hypothetical protein